MEVQPVTGVTHREEVKQPVSFPCWLRRWAQSAGFSLTEFSCGFTFSSSLFLFHLPPVPMALHRQVVSGGQGRGAAPCKPGAGATDRLAGILQEQRVLFPFPGEAWHITSAMRLTSADPGLGMSLAKMRVPGLCPCQEAKPRMRCG